MSLDEINTLVLEDVINEVKSRVFASLDPQPVFDEETDGDFLEWYDSLFTQEQLDTEFLVYKQELIDAENERLRKEDLKTRFDSLKDMRLAFHTLHPDKPNPALFLKELLEKEPSEAESDISALEAKDAELFAEIEASRYIELRKKEYPSIEELVVALWEKDEAAIAELESKRQAVKAKYPKE